MVHGSGGDLQCRVVSAARKRRRRPSNGSLIILLVVVVAAVVVARYAQSHGLPGQGPGSSAAPGVLRATPVTGHLTGTAPASCREHSATDGQPLPDPACTPGVVSDEVSQTNLDTTICRSGY